MEKLNSFLKLFHYIAKEKIRFSSIKENPEKRANYRKYGIQSILFSIFGILFSFTSIFLNGVANSNNIVYILFIGLILIVFAFIAPILFLLNAILYSILQLVLNKKAIGFISLTLSILSIIPLVLIYLKYLG